MSETFHPLPTKQFEKLATLREPYCLSIYIPMYRSGLEQNQGLSQGHLKTCIKRAYQLLAAQGMNEKQIKKYMRPIKDLLTDSQLWRNPSDGLAIFMSKSLGMNFYLLPINFETTVYISDHYNLVPLVPLYEYDTTFYLLELSQDHVRLYQANQYEMSDLYVNEFAPERLEEAVGFDYEQKMLQFRTGHSLYSAGSFHGQGEGKDDENKELTFYFREINKGVNKALGNKNAPLVIACVDWLYPLYKNANTYINLHPDHIGGDPEFKNKTQLHKEAWSLIRGYHIVEKQQKSDLYGELIHTPKTSHQISEIVPAAVHGKIDTLFLRKGDDVYGTYNHKNNCVILDSDKAPYNLSLINMAAMNTFLQGGKVYTLEPNDMPVEKRPLNAIFRY